MNDRLALILSVLAIGACTSSDPGQGGSSASGGGGAGASAGDGGNGTSPSGSGGGNIGTGGDPSGGGGDSTGDGGGVPARDCAAEPDKCYVRVQDGHFALDGQTYRYMGTNFWAAPYMSRERLRAELDLLKANNVTNLRILALSEGGIPESQQNDEQYGPQRIYPASSDAPCKDAALEASVAKLRVALDEMRARGMKAVLTLNNWYHWSGGMPQYVKWAYEQPSTSCGGDYSQYIVNGIRDSGSSSLLASDHHQVFAQSSLFRAGTGDACAASPTGAFVIPHPNTLQSGGGDWSQAWTDQQDIATLFLCNAKAQEFFFSRAAYMIEQLKDHEAIMAWQLANEPRSFKGWSAIFTRWAQRTAKFIKSIDPNHLVSTGAEGELYQWGDYANADYRSAHGISEIDYLTLHVWPENWGWYDPNLPVDSTAGLSLSAATRLSDDFVARHVDHARALRKPLVLEEFGLARDDDSSPVSSSVVKRNRFYESMFNHVKNNQEFGGVNFWAWSGTGRPADDGNEFWRLGQEYIGDPPHEPQGWYSVYDSDTTTVTLIKQLADQIAGAP